MTDPTHTADIRAGDIEWLAESLERVWSEGRAGVKRPFNVMAADILCCLDGYTAPPSAMDPGAATRGPSRITLP